MRGAVCGGGVGTACERHTHTREWGSGGAGGESLGAACPTGPEDARTWYQSHADAPGGLGLGEEGLPCLPWTLPHAGGHACGPQRCVWLGPAAACPKDSTRAVSAGPAEWPTSPAAS